MSVLEVHLANCNSKSSKKKKWCLKFPWDNISWINYEDLSFGDKLAFLSQHVFHFHVLDDNKKNFPK